MKRSVLLLKQVKKGSLNNNSLRICVIDYEVNVNPDIAVPRGKTTNPKSRSVSKGNIQEIFNDVNFNGGNTAKVGNARPDKFDKKSKVKYVRIPNSE